MFPQSDRASDVADALERWLRELRVDIRLGTRVHGLVVEKKDQGGGDNEETPSKKSRSYSPALFSSFISGVRVFSGVIPADAVVLATGGITYPRTGSTGDGYRIAAEVGHTIVPPKPSLAALETAEPWVSQLQSLSLRNVTATLFSEKKKLAIEFGEMLFTHFGVSGPIILTLSKVYAGLSHKSGVSVSINLKPALSREQLESRLISDFSQKKQFKNYLPALLPRTLIPVFINLSGIPADLPVNRITKTQRKKIIDLLMDFRLQITGARPAEEAIVTSGGVSLKEIDPRTMGSLLVYGLHFAGEVIDIDATTGGYNLQAAFTTGWIAGESAANVLCATKKTQESNS